jgi:hypothetical protein
MKPFLELGQFVGPILSIAAIALLAIGCVIYVYGRDWIRAWRDRRLARKSAAETAGPPSAYITREEALSMLSETGQQIMRDLDVGEVLTGRSLFRFEKNGQWVSVSIEIEAPE